MVKLQKNSIKGQFASWVGLDSILAMINISGRQHFFKKSGGARRGNNDRPGIPVFKKCLATSGKGGSLIPGPI